MGELTNSDVFSWKGYLKAHRIQAIFYQLGATATDHGHPSARTENLSKTEAEKLFKVILKGDFTAVLGVKC